MEDTKNKNLWIGVVIVLVVVAGLLIWNMRKDSPLETVDDLEIESTEDVDEAAPGTSATSPAVSLSYAQALIKYKDARLQLDKTCQASPDKMVFKNGASLMVDNRAPVTRTVKVGTTFNIKAYGFKIVKLSSDTLPATWLVDCDQSQNVSTLLIQK